MDTAPLWGGDRGREFQQGRLSRAVGPQEDGEPFGERVVEVLQDRLPPTPVAIGAASEFEGHGAFLGAKIRAVTPAMNTNRETTAAGTS